MKSTLLTAICLLLTLTSLAGIIQPIAYSNQTMRGELQTRLMANFRRLHEEKYQPDNVFLTMEQSGDWPGDTEGRTILALVLDAQALHAQPQYLDEIIRRIPTHLNEKGYMGPLMPNMLHEQQLSGNGWMLRGLCEYYLWKKDPSTLAMITAMATNLFLPGAGKYAQYPISPIQREQNVGEYSGNIVGQIGQWKLSSDIGCVFIGMEGLIHAYCVTGDEALRPVVEELIHRFLEVDLVGIKAQTHATLTACRGLLRYAAYTGQQKYVDEAAKRFQLYVENGMTENYENYNWFDRFDTWTEPCAIVDSYLLAVQLWQHTHQPKYLEWAELIYYNGICHTQRHNGGFGTDTCPGKGSKTPWLGVSGPEAHWCCTMRGAEGLSNAARYSCFADENKLYFPFLRQASFKVKSGGHDVTIDEETDYPFANTATFTINTTSSARLTLYFPAYSWMGNPSITLNGKAVKTKCADGFIQLSSKFDLNDKVVFSFHLKEREEGLLNQRNALDGYTKRYLRGPLLLGKREGDSQLTPVYHLLDKSIWEPEEKGIQILFSTPAAPAKVHIERTDWAPEVKQGLNDLMDNYVQAGQKGYVVFDFDNTTAIFDISEQMFVYQLETMSFALTPEEFVPAIEGGLCSPSWNHHERVQRIGEWYSTLYKKYGPFSPKGVSKKTQAQMLKDPVWMDFASHLAALYNCIPDYETAEVNNYWFLNWVTGMNKQQVYDLAFRSHRFYANVPTAMGTWKGSDESPEEHPFNTYDWIRGVRVTDNIKELWKALSANGIDVWVCSASGLPQVMAAVDAFGLHGYCKGVLALTQQQDAHERYVSAYDYHSGVAALTDGDDWRNDTIPLGCQTAAVGKSEAIQRVLFPKYGQRGPIAGFMDSSGDFNFCTEFADLQLVVCFNRANRKVTDGGGLIAEVAMYEKNVLGYNLQKARETGDVLYLLQGRDENGLRTLRPSNLTLRYGEKQERLFCNEQNQQQYDYFCQQHLTVKDILNTFSRKTSADAPSNPLGFRYGFLDSYKGYKSR